MRKERSFLDKITLFLKGLAMGTANKVPGVSGGVVAFVLGFYNELIYSFQKMNFKALKLLLNGRFRSLYSYMNLSFLMLVMGGSLFSYISVSILLDYLLRAYETQVWGSFFGMILGSVYYIARKYRVWNLYRVLILFIGVFIGVVLSFMPPAIENSNLWFVFFCGVIGVSGMTLPGLSGSFLLMLLGNYVLLLVDTVNVVFKIFMSVLVGDLEPLQDAENVNYLKIGFVFFMGSFVGLVSISHLLGYVIKRWEYVVNALIIGFITGSLGIVWPWKETLYKLQEGHLVYDKNGNAIIENYQRFMPDIYNLDTWVTIGFILIGLAVVLGIDYYERKKSIYV